MDQDYGNPYGQNQTPLKPGDPGYRMAPWAPDYQPGPDWNNGVYQPPAPRYDYNGGSAPNQPLEAGMNRWEWEGPQQAQWNMSNNQWDRGVWQQRAAPPPASGGGGNSGGGSGAVPAMPAAAPSMPQSTSFTPTRTPIQSAAQDALLKYLSRTQETPSLSDSTLAPQVEVFRAQAQRGQERQRLAAAERAAANGQSESGYLDNLINQGIQNQNFNTSAFNANLLGGEMDKRREAHQNALQLAIATGNAEAARELQARLGFGDLDLRRFLGTEGLNQNALQMLLGGY